MALPTIKVEQEGLALYVEGVRVVAIQPLAKRISIGDKHIVIDGRDVTQTIPVPGVGTYSISSTGAGRITITQLGGLLSATVEYSTATGEISQIAASLHAMNVLAGVKVGATLETSLRPISFNNQIVFNGSFTAKFVIFGNTVYSQTKSRPIGLHDSVDAFAVLSAGFLSPENNPNIKAFLDRLKRTKEGDLPGMSSLTREEVLALLTLFKTRRPTDA